MAHELGATPHSRCSVSTCHTMRNAVGRVERKDGGRMERCLPSLPKMIEIEGTHTA